jgi:hypothetical protein
MRLCRYSEGLGHLDREAVQIEVILVAVLREPFARRLRGAPPHRHDLQGDDIAFVAGDIAEEIGDAEPAFIVLAREREAGQLAFAIGIVEDHVVAFGGARPIAVGGLRHQDVLADRDVENAPQYRAQFVLGLFPVLGEGLAVRPVTPLELVEHALVERGHDRLPAPGRSSAAPRRAAPGPAHCGSVRLGSAGSPSISTGRSTLGRASPGPKRDLSASLRDNFPE